MSAVKITRAFDPVRTGATWEQDVVFTLADKVTPQPAWAGCTAEVVLSPKSPVLAVEHAFRVAEAAVTVGPTDARVRIRVPFEATADYYPADYNIEINRIDADGERHPAAVGGIEIQQGLVSIIDNAVLLTSPTGSGGAGTIIVTALGSTYASGVGSSGLGLREWKTINSAYVAVTGDRLICDSRTGSFPVTLPAFGGEVWLRDLDGSFAAHTVTVLGNGRTIGGDASLLCDAAGFQVHLVSADDAWGYGITYVYGGAE